MWILVLIHLFILLRIRKCILHFKKWLQIWSSGLRIVSVLQIIHRELCLHSHSSTFSDCTTKYPCLCQDPVSMSVVFNTHDQN